MLFKTDIYGEIHTKEDRDRIEDLIRKNHKVNPYQYLLTEELGSVSALTDSDKRIGIRNHLYSISPRSYELGIELKIPVIGIDLWDDDVYKDDVKDSNGMAIDFKRSFLMRETYMVNTIRTFSRQGNCAVIVGDSHLRLTKTKELGDISLLQKAFRSEAQYIFHRSPNREIN